MNIQWCLCPIYSASSRKIPKFYISQLPTCYKLSITIVKINLFHLSLNCRSDKINIEWRSIIQNDCIGINITNANEFWIFWNFGAHGFLGDSTDDMLECFKKLIAFGVINSESIFSLMNRDEDGVIMSPIDFSDFITNRYWCPEAPRSNLVDEGYDKDDPRYFHS